MKLVEAADIEGDYGETPVLDPIFSKSADVLKWEQKFEKRYGFIPDYQALLDYDATGMLLKTIATYGAAPEAIVDGLGKIKYEGLGGTYQADAEGNMLHAVSIVQIHDLKQIELDRAEVAFKPRN